jgi:hypothetical protein
MRVGAQANEADKKRNPRPRSLQRAFAEQDAWRGYISGLKLGSESDEFRSDNIPV